jgi:dihydroceramidase
MDSIWANLNTFVLQRIVHSDSPLHQHHSSYLGYWGKPTSTVDWCENNYEISHYIAEFFNTFSSFAMVIIGVAGIMLHWNQYRLESRFIMGLLGVAVVGFGSAAFHGTLWFGLQVHWA